MKVLYNNPNDPKYYQWMDNNGIHDIWYLDKTNIYDYRKCDLPNELITLLDKWNEKMINLRETFEEGYPVKSARIEFIYRDYIYSIFPYTISAMTKSIFKANEGFILPWDALFEAYQKDIRDDLEKELGVKYSKYIGFLD